MDLVKDRSDVSESVVVKRILEKPDKKISFQSSGVLEFNISNFAMGSEDRKQLLTIKAKQSIEDIVKSSALQRNLKQVTYYVSKLEVDSEPGKKSNSVNYEFFAYEK